MTRPLPAPDVPAARPADPDPDLSAESIVVQIRWVGLLAGGILANWVSPTADPAPLNAILLLGLGYTALDTLFFARGRVFLKDAPLLVSAMEALFIGLLCHFEGGPDSPFRFYYLLSLVCCAIRYSKPVTYATCLLDCASYGLLFAAQPADRRDVSQFVPMLAVLVWVTWAASALAGLVRRASERLRGLNAELRHNQEQLETRIAERTLQLEETQAQVLHQEKMAAFGLLAAGIAHEVGNPLTSISALVQLLERRNPDEYTRERLGQVSGQLVRIQAILRELVTFSRPASDQRGRVFLKDVVDEALGIAKYYRGGKSRTITAAVPADLPPLAGVRDQLVQVVFNLVLNAIDATGKGGTVAVAAEPVADRLVLTVTDDGHGIPPEVRDRLFRPYFTTKKHGTGLGLFVIRKIVEAHAGTVTVDSEPGRGTRFRVELPASAPPE